MIAFNKFIQIELLFNISPKITSLGRYTALEMVIAVLELRYWISLQVVGYNRLNVFESPKMSPLRGFYNFGKRKMSQKHKSVEQGG